jgi:alkanesulfonate monooxygenase SsuD/methylene tetrahydromethanopterin reductase-like flavin-dependent oxidoreductase (luciferase family)
VAIPRFPPYAIDSFNYASFTTLDQYHPATLTLVESIQIARKSQFFSEDGAIYGTPEQLVEKFQERAVAGCEHFQLRFADFPSAGGVARFGKEVLPKVR